MFISKHLCPWKVLNLRSDYRFRGSVNVDGRILVRFQMPQPARPEFYVESDVEPGAVLVVSVESRVYAVERKSS